MRISWCANYMNLRNARCNDKDVAAIFRLEVSRTQKVVDRHTAFVTYQIYYHVHFYPEDGGRIFLRNVGIHR